MDGDWLDDLYDAAKIIFWTAVAGVILTPILLGVIVYLIVAK